MRNQEGIKIELQKKVHRKICVRDITVLTARPPFYVTFIAFFVYSLLLSKWLTSWIVPINIHNILIESILYDDIMSEWSNILQFNTSWLASLRTRYILDFVLASVFLAMNLHLLKRTMTLPLTKKSHIFIFYSFFLLLVTVVAQFTAKATNSEKAIYFLSLISCSINKLKSRLLFTCKSLKVSRKFYVFRFTMEKNFYHPGFKVYYQQHTFALC